MLFKDVLHILQDQVASIGITNPELCTMLFTDASPDDAELYTDKAKKGFSSRGLAGDDRSKYCSEEAFPNLYLRLAILYADMIFHLPINIKLKQTVTVMPTVRMISQKLSKYKNPIISFNTGSTY